MAPRLTQKEREKASKTRIQLLVYCSSPVNVASTIEEAHKLYEPYGLILDNHRWSHPTSIADHVSQEKREIDFLTKALVKHLPMTWKKAIAVVPWADIPPCEACGWTAGAILEK